ncbi:MAG TPA: hypothetical protein VI814_08615 [Candidatus Limnocylindria bacterium]
MSTAARALAYVPGLGFRRADAVMLREPVTEKVDEWSVTVDHVVADAEATQVAVTIYGPFAWTGDRFKAPDVEYGGLIQARSAAGDVVSSDRQRMFPLSHSVSHAGTSISCTANMDALTDLSERLDILIGPPLPPLVIPVTLTPVHDFAIPARSVNVSDSHHGVVLTAEAVGRGESMTAVLLHAALEPSARKRFMRALGTFRDMPRDPPGITLVDERGASVTPFAATRELSQGPEIRMIAVFPAISPDARSAALTVPFVVLSEHLGAPLRLPVPWDGDVALGDDTAHVRTGRDSSPRGGAAVTVEVEGTWHDDRRVLFAESLTVSERYGGVGFRAMPAEPPIVTYTEDPTGEADAVSLESPVIQLRGPWTMTLPLP